MELCSKFGLFVGSSLLINLQKLIIGPVHLSFPKLNRKLFDVLNTCFPPFGLDILKIDLQLATDLSGKGRIYIHIPPSKTYNKNAR